MENGKVRSGALNRSAVPLDALDSFYDACAARAYALALRVLPGDRETAEEIVVRTFVALWQSQPAAGAGETACTERMLLAQVRERCIDVLHSRADAVYRTDEGTLSPHFNPRTVRDETTSAAAAIRERLAALLLDQRDAIERAFYRGQTSEHIAMEMGMSKGEVHMAMRRGLWALANRPSDDRSPATSGPVQDSQSGVRVDGETAGEWSSTPSPRRQTGGMSMEATYSEPRLLVIDDDPGIVTLVSRALNEVGWHVSTCSDPARACEQVADEPPNAVLLDIHLQFPVSGWRVLQALREDESTREVPVIVFSGQIRELEAREAWLLEHKIGVLSKPFELEDLYQAVEEYHPSNANLSRPLEA